MELCGYGNRIAIKDNKAGCAIVTVGNESLYVKCLVISKDTVNYADILDVNMSLSKLMNNTKRKLNFNEIRSYLIDQYGEQNVI
jgi:hypothetical protein